MCWPSADTPAPGGVLGARAAGGADLPRGDGRRYSDWWRASPSRISSVKNQSTEGKSTKGHRRWFCHETGLLVLLALEWIYFNAIGHRFGTLDNTFDLLRHSVEIGLLALAITPVILAGGIDLSVGSLLGLCAILFGKLWRDAHMPIAMAAGAALAFGALGGLVNAGLIPRRRLPALIVTLATFSLFRGLAEAITAGLETFPG